MESWWELGEWRGHSGNTLEVWRLTDWVDEEAISRRAPDE
jgi:hypothetical protein